jgi:hypothetical protein
VGARVGAAVALGLGVAVDPEVGGGAGDGRRHWQNKKIAATREVIAAHCRKADRETKAIDLLGGLRRIRYSEFCRGMDHCHEKILRHPLIDKSETGSEDELCFYVKRSKPRELSA